jgi:hypothetical protein
MPTSRLPTRSPLRILAACCAFTAGTIFYVHYSQVTERDRMRAAVLRDIERERAEARKEQARTA